jgi:DNA-binding transcriptional regulator of glucitol operon
MRKEVVWPTAALIVMVMIGVLVQLPAAIQQESAQSADSMTLSQKCLACHGPFDKLAEKTAAFVASSGETITPHQYIPHQDKKEFPECIECHRPHPVPLEDKSLVVRPDNVNWCYTGCHHASNLQPCKNCH